MEKKKKRKRFYDYSLLFAVLFITGFGMLMMYSASSYSAQNQLNNAQYYLHRQMIFAGGGIVLMLLISKVDYHRLWKASLGIYILCWIAVIATGFIGLSSHGSQRWISVFGMRVQPSEFMKAGIIIFLAALITAHDKKMQKLNPWLGAFCVALFPGLVTVGTNLSTAIIIVGIGGVMLFVANDKYWPFAILAAIAVFGYIGAYPIAKLFSKFHILQEYQLTRIFAWRDPSNYIDDTYQTIQGLYAIGSGGIFGKGLGESIQKFLIPEAQNDMIFTIICEELGLFGAVSLILIYGFIIYRLYDIAKNAKDLFGSMLVIGVMVHISLQAILNIAVATNSIPNTGITLPFVSYGGTSLVLLLMECGMCLSVSGQIEVE